MATPVSPCGNPAPRGTAKRVAVTRALTLFRRESADNRADERAGEGGVELGVLDQEPEPDRAEEHVSHEFKVGSSGDLAALDAALEDFHGGGAAPEDEGLAQDFVEVGIEYGVGHEAAHDRAAVPGQALEGGSDESLQVLAQRPAVRARQ